jgi:hypothetical protein
MLAAFRETIMRPRTLPPTTVETSMAMPMPMPMLMPGPGIGVSRAGEVLSGPLD